MDSNEFYDYEGRAYINPTLSSGEQEAFINNLRDIQTQNNAQIAQQTYNLGTQVPSNLGGLGGGEAYFDARYQTPQVDEMVSTLKSAAQAQALNDVMSNYQAQLKQKYSQAQQNYNKRQRARQNALQNALLGGSTPKGEVDVEDPTEEVTLQGAIAGGVGPGDSGVYTTSAYDVNGKYYVQRDQNNNIVNTNAPGYSKGSDGYYHKSSEVRAQKDAADWSWASPVGFGINVIKGLFGR